MFFSSKQTTLAMLIVTLWSLLSAATMAQTGQGIYFPPPGESLNKQQMRQPEAIGLKPAVVAQLKGTAIRWALWRNGYLVHAEGDFNHEEDVYSLRKTWHALTVGAAIKQGRIPALKQPISVWEKDLTGNDARATWQHVLTQSSGFDYPYGKHPDYQPGAMWTYSDHNLRRLTSALAKVYGKQHMYDHYNDVLKAAYFDAIGMRGWFTSKHAEDDGPRLNLDLEDLGRLGLLVLARGQWQGKEIIPRSFIEQLERKQTRGMKVNYDGPNDGRPSLLYGHEDKFPEAPYGYLTWVNTDGDVYPQADRAWAWGAGRGGHMVFWNHRLGIVFACHGRKAEAVIPETIEANLIK